MMLPAVDVIIIHQLISPSDGVTSCYLIIVQQLSLSTNDVPAVYVIIIHQLTLSTNDVTSCLCNHYSPADFINQ